MHRHQWLWTKADAQDWNQLKYLLGGAHVYLLTLPFTLFCGPFLRADEGEAPVEVPGLITLNADQITKAEIGTEISAPAWIRLTVSIPAKVKVNEEAQAHVVAKAAGIVTKINKNVGDTVRKGESLAILESKEIAEAKAAYITALKRDELAAQTAAAEEGLRDKKISSEQDYLRTLLASKEAHLNLEVAIQQLYILGLDQGEINRLAVEGLEGLRRYEIKAPLDGVVVGKSITLGEFLDSDHEVFMIANLDSVWVELGIYPKDLPLIGLGNKVYVAPIKGDLPFAEGVITQLSPTVNEDTHTAAAVVTLSNTARKWFPGTFVSADILVEEFQVPVAVRKEAVHEIDGNACLFIPCSEGFQKVDVTLGKSDRNYVEVISGLDPGTPYAATNTFLLKAELGKAEAEL